MRRPAAVRRPTMRLMLRRGLLKMGLKCKLELEMERQQKQKLGSMMLLAAVMVMKWMHMNVMDKSVEVMGAKELSAIAKGKMARAPVPNGRKQLAMPSPN